MHLNRNFFALALIWFCLLLVSGKAELITDLPVPKWADQAHPPAHDTLFFTSGIPLSESRVKTTDELAIKDAKGTYVPSQFTPLAYWPDGSFKWVAISPVLSPEATLPLGLYREYVEADQAPIKVEETSGSVRIKTDLLEVKVGEQGGTFAVRKREWESKWLQIDWELERLTQPAQKSRSGWQGERSQVKEKLLDGFALTYDQQREVAVEEAGPIRAVIRVKGNFTGEDGVEFCRYDYRLYVYAGAESVHWQPSWIFTGDPETESIARLEGIVAIQGAEFDRVNVGYLEETDESHMLDLGEDVLQENLDDLRLAGWLSAITAGGESTNIAVREFWQNFPSGWRVDANQIVIGFWPGSSRYYLDLARTSDGTGDGESETDRNSNASGTAKTFNVLIAPAMATERFEQLAAVFEQEPLFYPGSQYMVDTGVLGPIAYEDVHSFPRLEGFFRASIHWLLANRNQYGWYGFVDYGDVRTNFNHAQKQWRTQGRYGWRQGAGDIPQAIMVQYFRTGDPVAWELGAPYARHVLDVDTVHAGNQNKEQDTGGMHRRGQDHWSGKTQSQYTYTQGAFLYHYLSGDLRARSVLLEEVAPWQSDRSQAWSANAANTTLRAWEATGDPEWRKLARQQILPHLESDTYDNFRFANDFVPALTQYAWMTGDDEAWSAVRQRTAHILDSQNWAYFHPSISRRGGRYMLPALLYYLDGDETTYLRYPGRTFATLLPDPPPPEPSWNFEVLSDYLRRGVPPHGVSATTQFADIGDAPYFIAALQTAGWDERKLRSLPQIYGTRRGAHLIGTYANVGQSVHEYQNEWAYISLPATDKVDEVAKEQLMERLRGLPFGAVLYVNNIPFQLAAPGGAATDVLRLTEASSVSIPVPKGATGVYFLGPMIENGDWREGADVIRYTLHLKGGGQRVGTWNHLVDLDDFRGFHYATQSTPGRFWQIGNSSRVHASVLFLNFDGEEVERIVLEDSGEGYASFILAATAALDENKNVQPLTEIAFGLETDGPNRYVLGPNRVAESNEEIGWAMPEREIARLEFMDDKVVSEGTVALQVPVANGEYLVELNLGNTHILGGVLLIGVSGNSLDAMAVSGGNGDRIKLPAKVRDGVLRISIQALPGLLTTTNQRARWQLNSVKIWPLPSGDWSFQPELEMTLLQGEALGEYAELSQSTGATNSYTFWGVEQLLPGGTEYRVDRPEYPQDVIFTFDSSVEMSGFVFAPLAGFGPKSLTIQVKGDEDEQWQEIGFWELEPDSAGIRAEIDKRRVREVRFLMNGDQSRKSLRILQANVYGNR